LPISSRQIDESISIADFFPPFSSSIIIIDSTIRRSPLAARRCLLPAAANGV
jgi:hypothetical protein